MLHAVAGPPAADDRFCGGCGAELALACPHCGRPARARTPPSAPAAAGAGAPAPNRDDGAQEDRRRVSVLFVDLIDFTPTSSAPTRSWSGSMQTGFFAAARRVIGQYGGVVEKYIGDAVMALFGAPVATETDAAALRAGRAGAAAGAGPVRRPSDGRRRCGSGSASPPARPWSTWPPPATAARPSSPATWSTPPPGCSRWRRPAGCWSAAAPTRPPGPRSGTRRSRRSTLRGPLAPRPRCGWRWPRCSAAARPGGRRHPRWSTATHELGLLVNALHRGAARPRPAAGHRARPGRHRQEPAGARAVPARRAAASTRRSTWRTGRCPPFGENVTYAALADIVKAAGRHPATPTPPTTARERLDAARCATWSARPRPARLSDALGPLVGLPGSTAAGRGGRVGLAAVPGRAGRAPPDRAGLRGPALGRRADAAVRRAARRLGAGRAAAAAVHRPAGAAGPRAELGRRGRRAR